MARLSVKDLSPKTKVIWFMSIVGAHNVTKVREFIKHRHDWFQFRAGETGTLGHPREIDRKIRTTIGMTWHSGRMFKLEVYPDNMRPWSPRYAQFMAFLGSGSAKLCLQAISATGTIPLQLTFESPPDPDLRSEDDPCSDEATQKMMDKGEYIPVQTYEERLTRIDGSRDMERFLVKLAEINGFDIFRYDNFPSLDTIRRPCVIPDFFWDHLSEDQKLKELKFRKAKKQKNEQYLENCEKYRDFLFSINGAPERTLLIPTHP